MTEVTVTAGAITRAKLQIVTTNKHPAVYYMKFLQNAQIWLSMWYGGVIIMSLDGVQVTGSNSSHFTFFWQLWAYCLRGHIPRSPSSSVWPKTRDALGLTISPVCWKVKVKVACCLASPAGWVPRDWFQNSDHMSFYLYFSSLCRLQVPGPMWSPRLKE